jgi:hypothetical protein
MSLNCRSSLCESFWPWPSSLAALLAVEKNVIVRLLAQRELRLKLPRFTDLHGFGPIAHRRDEIPVFERDRTVERLESLARQIKSRNW